MNIADMRRNLVAVVAMAVVLIAAGTALFAGETDEPVNKYFGNNAKVCKACHKEQVLAWEQWAMAGSWDKLCEEEQLNPNCIKCHVTGYGEPGGFVSFEETPTLVGITCEACHGPAGAHMKVPPKDLEGRRGSMSRPDEANCLQCHIEEGNPNFKEFVYDDEVAELADHIIAEEEEAEPGSDEAAGETEADTG